MSTESISFLKVFVNVKVEALFQNYLWYIFNHLHFVIINVHFSCEFSMYILFIFPLVFEFSYQFDCLYNKIGPSVLFITNVFKFVISLSSFVYNVSESLGDFNFSLVRCINFSLSFYFHIFMLVELFSFPL